MTVEKIGQDTYTYQGVAVNVAKNRQRDTFTFANINLLGRCNVNCFFCLGKDIANLLNRHNQLKVHFNDWRNFSVFLAKCRQENVRKIYVTGQNTDSLLYEHIDELVTHLHSQGFEVGLRTNGFLAPERLAVINRCGLSTGYSVHTLDPMTQKMIMGRIKIPNWEEIIPATERPRISIVLNRCNQTEVPQLIRFLSEFKNVRYIQVRRVSTDKRVEQLVPDMVAYEQVYSEVRKWFPLLRTFAGDAEVYEMYGKEIVFWRTTKTSVNSLNYFTDGTVSDMYFVVEGYLKNMGTTP